MSDPAGIHDDAARPGPWLEAGVAIVLLALYGLLVRHIPLSGDEFWYVARARLIPALLSQVVHLDWAQAAATLTQIVDRGWFMPGMSILIAPLTLISDSVPLMRLFVGALNFVLVCVLLRLLQETFGGRIRLAYVALAAIVPYYAFYFFMLWGDLLAAHLLLVLCLLLYRRIRLAQISLLSVRAAAGFGLALGITTHVRGFYWGFAPLFVLGFFFATASAETLGLRLRSTAARTGAFLAGLVVVIAPWTVAVSVHHGFHVTTTTTTLSHIMLLGGPDYLPHTTPANLVFAVDDRIRVLAQANGRSYAAQAQLERAEATAGLTVETYLSKVAHNISDFVFRSEMFLTRFSVISGPSPGFPPAEWRRGLFSAVMMLNHVGWRVLLAAGIVLFLLPIRFAEPQLLVSTMFKYAVAVYSIQPFLVIVHGRYYVEYVPLIAMALAVAFRQGRAVLPTARPVGLDQWIVALGQVVALLAGAAVVVGYVLLG